MIVYGKDLYNMADPSSAPYLSKIRTVTNNSTNTTQTVSWNFWPRQYQYTYSYLGETHIGFYSGGSPNDPGGILVPTEDSTKDLLDNGFYYIDKLNRVKRRDVFEGIRIKKIAWRTIEPGQNKDTVAWHERDYNDIHNYEDSTINLTATREGTTFEVQATYELCTMGLPHRDIPFFYFNRYGQNSTYYGGSFTDIVPKDPGREYSKVPSCFEVISPIKIGNHYYEHCQWGDPRVVCYSSNGTETYDKTQAGWTYQNAITNDNYFDSNYTKWNNNYSFEYQDVTPLLNHDGWISDTPTTSQVARKSVYWTYTRTYTDRYTVNNLASGDAEYKVMNGVAINVIPNHCDSNLQGEEGKVNISCDIPYSVKNNVSLYALQRLVNVEHNTYYYKNLLLGTFNVPNGQTVSYNYKFYEKDLIPGNEIRYYATAELTKEQRQCGSVYIDINGSTNLASSDNVTVNLQGDVYVKMNGSIRAGASNIVVDLSGRTRMNGSVVLGQHVIMSSLPENALMQNDLISIKDISFNGSNNMEIIGSIKGKVHVNGSLRGKLIIRGNLGDDIRINANGSIYGNIEINGDISGPIKVDVNGSIRGSIVINANVTGPVTIHSNGSIGGDITINGKIGQYIYIDSNGSAGGNVVINVNGDLSGYFHLHINGSVRLPKNLNINVDGKINTSTINLADDFSSSWKECAAGHYYNLEPRLKNAWLESDINLLNSAPIKWNALSDPDNDEVYYNMYTQRIRDVNNKALNPYTSNFYGYTEGTLNYEREIPYIYNAYYNLDMTNYDYNEQIKIWVIARDKYINRYYYTSTPFIVKRGSCVSAKILTGKITTEVRNPITNNYMVDGTKGTITVTYRHEKNRPGTVVIEAYQSTDNRSTGAFFKVIKTLTFDETMINAEHKEASQTFEIDFIEEGFVRSRDIRYFAKATDVDGMSSFDGDLVKWEDCTYGHHFNDEPEPTTPWIENLNTIEEDGVAKIKWNIPKDTDGDTSIYYRVYLADGDKTSNNVLSKEFYGPFISGEQHYFKEYVTENNYIDLNIYDFKDDTLLIWIESHDYYVNNYYYTGGILDFKNKGTAPNPPKLIVYYAHGEYGELSIHYSHPLGREGEVTLYAICNYTKDNSKKIFTVFKNQSITNGGVIYFTNDFVDNFGKTPQDRSCSIRYFATARVSGFESAEASTVPLDWEPNIEMYENWIGGHYFNEEPPKPNLSLNTEKSNLYRNAYLQWDALPDPDGDTVRYQIYLRAESAVYTYNQRYKYFYGIDGQQDLLMYCDLLAETRNNYLNIDLTHYKTYGEKFEVFVKSWDTYENSYYYCSDILNFQKLEYSRPEMKLEVTPVHGEKGDLNVIFHHPDASLTGDAAEDRGCTDGLVKLYAYVSGNEAYPIDITNLISPSGTNAAVRMKSDESKLITIDFDKDLGISRGHDISYYAIVRDIDDPPGLYNTDFFYTQIPAKDRYYGHYFNSIPVAPNPYGGTPDSIEDMRIYDFAYTNIIWRPTIDPDDDIVDYFIYIRTPEGMNEEIHIDTFTCNFAKEEREFNRKYKMSPLYDEASDTYIGYEISQYSFADDQYTPIYTKDKIQFRLDYSDNGVEWPESIDNDGVGVYYYWVESRDRYNNSYYNSSARIRKDRKRHEKPNKVSLICEPAHGEKGKITINYTHPENLDATVKLYAFMDKDTNPILIDTLDFIFTQDQLDDYLKTGVNKGLSITYEVLFTKYNELERSHNICYYAVAEDTIVHLKSDDRELKDIPYEEKATGHYYNEEPPCTTPMFLFDVADQFILRDDITYEETPFNTLTLIWKKVKDPDGDNVNYNFYMDGPIKYEKTTKEFFGDYGNNVEDDNYVTGKVPYNLVKKVTPNTLSEQNTVIKKDTLDEYIYYQFNISEFNEDGNITIWIETDDNYENSYYRSGKRIILKRGHKARDINAAWPKNYSTIYSKHPRILIKLAEDDLKQEVKVFWKDTWYTNKDPEFVKYYSCEPKITKYDDGTTDQFIVFRPPVSQTAYTDSKIVYGIKVNNTCTETETKWYQYTYVQFGYNFTDPKFIPLKYIHMNELRPCIQKLVDAYGKDFQEDEGYIIKDRVINKGDVVDNEDYNQIAIPLRILNEYINTADNSLNMDNEANVVIKNDLDLMELIELEDKQDNDYITSDFREWKILLYLLQNM